MSWDGLMPTGLRYVVPLAAAAVVMTACASDDDDPRTSEQDAVEIVSAYAAGTSGEKGVRTLVDQTGPALGGEPDLSGGDGASPLAAVAAAEADGRTVGVAPTSALTLQPQLSDVGYDGIDDFEPVLMTSTQPVVLSVDKDAPYDRLRDLVAISKELTTKVASTGRQTPQGIDALLFAEKSGADLVQKRFDDDRLAVRAVAGGKADVAVTTAAAAIPKERAGDIRVLGAFVDRPVEAFPNAPTMPSKGYDIAFGVDNIVVTPAGTSAERVGTLRDAFTEAADSDAYQEFLAANGYAPQNLSGRKLAAYVDKQHAQYEKAVADLGLASG
ncbi:tripartite tricarboxylate transporter substrate-binding protein [Solicola gregarius]|uniref:Tripartite tricarboxylate transporter substrate binding protein n=1 Tax=Solicola gregarius TaxID=2908642 RepID=A0AA46TF22_9ACTN|nr:tripartite tricarboxylate transporter substrate-binding protein [Solicola gregarius]UYM04141.1 hypothetical protein L0C25_16540 [Solicola gregarius]